MSGSRSEFLEIEEGQHYPRAEQVYTPEVVQEPERLVMAPEHGPPGALEAIPRFHPFGETEFAWIYRQLQNLDAGQGGAGDVVTTGETNIFTVHQEINVTDLGVSVIPLLIDINNAAAGVSYPLRLGHRYQPGVGPVGLGVGISLEVESATEGVKNSIAAFEAQSTVNTNGAMTAEAGINVVVAGNPERVMTFGHQRIRNLFQPAAATTHALFELGTGSFVGDASGTYYGARAVTGYTGDFINMQVNGATKFRVDENGAIYQNGVLLTGGGDAFIGVSNAWSAAQTLTLDDTASAAVSYPLRLRHTHSAGAGAAGIGAGVQFELETATNGTVSTFGRLVVDASNVGVGNLTSAFHLLLQNNNTEREMLTVLHNYAGVRQPPAEVTDRSLWLLGSDAFTGHALGTLYGASMATGFAGDMLNLQVGARPRTLVSGIGRMTQTVHDGATTGPTAALQIEHRIDTAGTPAVGMGVGLEFRADDAGKTLRVFGKIEADGRVLTSGVVDADLVLYNSVGGSQTESLRCRASDQNVRIIGRLLAQSGWGTGNNVARTTLATPGTITGQIEVYDAFTGASLGSLPLYANGSFS